MLINHCPQAVPGTPSFSPEDVCEADWAAFAAASYSAFLLAIASIWSFYIDA
jgi:hypothetical protein